MLNREAEVSMKSIFFSSIALLTACASSQLHKPTERVESAVNCGVLVYTSAAGARGLERVCNERPVKFVR
jgi:hypothetical protein